MSFLNNYSYTIRRSNKEIFYFYIDNGLCYKYLENNKNEKKINILEDYINDFTLFNFSIDNDDNIYGIITIDNIKILKCDKNNYNFYMENILKYDFQKFGISYPYIKKINNTFHIFCYVYDKEESNSSILFYINKKDNCLKEQKIDFIQHTVLNEYKILWLDNTSIIFYFNIINNKEEIFCSVFDDSNNTWSNPIQITNTNTNKLYLDVIFKDDFFHITYCYKLDDNYCISYIRGNFNDNIFKQDISKNITDPSIYVYPSFVVEENTLYITWVHLNKLFTCFSEDNGSSWSEKFIDSNSRNYPFLRSKFLSNYKDDLNFNNCNLFILENEISFLGF